MTQEISCLGIVSAGSLRPPFDNHKDPCVALETETEIKQTTRSVPAAGNGGGSGAPNTDIKVDHVLLGSAPTSATGTCGWRSNRLQSARVEDGVSAVVFRGSTQVKAQAEGERLDKIFFWKDSGSSRMRVRSTRRRRSVKGVNLLANLF